MTKKAALIILDGWGIGKKDNSDAIFNANTPFTDSLTIQYPNATLRTDGENVGLPEGQMGNSEVGHMNIGAGRIVFQELVRINKEIREKKFHCQPQILKAFAYAHAQHKKVHLIGLISDGGVHSHWKHASALAEIASTFPEVTSLFHVITDGRDTDPNSGLGFMQSFEESIAATPAKIASVIGRYYAMDRDKRWERVKKAYDLMVHGTGEACNTAQEAIEKSYQSDVTDEFIEPHVITPNFQKIESGDVVICFNFRTDRCREITEVLSQRNIPELDMQVIPNLYYVTMTQYDERFENVHVIYEKDNLTQTLGEVIASAGRTQLRIAETEKYPHVTFFFSGGREANFEGESRAMIPSPKVATYDLQPEMSAAEIRDTVNQWMLKDQPDFICLNFANPDMVGHTGVYSAITKAVETVDACLRSVVETGLQQGYQFVIIADHGNADKAFNEDGSPNTAHTTNPVPVWVIGENVTSVNNGILADVAPTILDLMDIKKPELMSGLSLIQR
jgi:2,3-bisphosphoglycerate-independent phosphoglycerate mutase